MTEKTKDEIKSVVLFLEIMVITSIYWNVSSYSILFFVSCLGYILVYFFITSYFRQKRKIERLQKMLFESYDKKRIEEDINTDANDYNDSM